jgi:hypothetical protein
VRGDTTVDWTAPSRRWALVLCAVQCGASCWCLTLSPLSMNLTATSSFVNLFLISLATPKLPEPMSRICSPVQIGCQHIGYRKARCDCSASKDRCIHAIAATGFQQSCGRHQAVQSATALELGQHDSTPLQPSLSERCRSTE